MARHDHRQLHGSELTDAARAAMLSGGEQWTGMRAAVFDTLSGETRPASAYDIADKVGRQLGRRVVPNSVYRILDLFVANNIARRVESSNAYVANAHPGCRHDCIYLVCDGCGATTHLDDDTLSDRLRDRVGATGFTVDRPVIEVRGRCAACASPAS